MVSSRQVLQEAGARRVVQVRVGPSYNPVEEVGDRRPNAIPCVPIADAVAEGCEQAMHRVAREEVVGGLCIVAKSRRHAIQHGEHILCSCVRHVFSH